MPFIFDVEVKMVFTGRIETETEAEGRAQIAALNGEAVWNDRDTFWLETFKPEVTEVTEYQEDEQAPSTSQ